MRQEVINIYKFDELNDRAKENARRWFAAQQDGMDFDFVIEDAARIGELLGIEFATHAVKLYGGGTRREADIFWSGFSSQGDGASFAGTYRYQKGAVKALKTYAPLNTELHNIATALQQAQAKHFYQIVTQVTQSGHYCHDRTMCFDHYREDGKEFTEDAEIEAIEEALCDFARWIYRQLDTQNDFIDSEEYIDDAIKVNNYEFNANGSRA